MKTGDRFVRAVQGGWRVFECVGVHKGQYLVMHWQALHATKAGALLELRTTR